MEAGGVGIGQPLAQQGHIWGLLGWSKAWSLLVTQTAHHAAARSKLRKLLGRNVTNLSFLRVTICWRRSKTLCRIQMLCACSYDEDTIRPV